jgi:uncharacterized protein with ATP-grasp and redox domains
MDVTLDCVPCLVRQALEAARMVSSQVDVQERVLRRVLSVLKDLSYDKTPPHMATVVHAAIREELDVADPYREVKDQSAKLANRLVGPLEEVVAEAADPFETALRLAIAGNVIDFGIGGVDSQKIQQAISDALSRPLPSHHIDALRSAVEQAANILYLGDNAGEVAFDRLLIEQIPTERVTFAVRGGPVLNDATRVDAEAAGLHHLVEVVDNGSTAPGTILELCTPSFQRRFRRADLIIAKGQGNYESLSSETAPIFFLLKVKCPVIAQHLNCAVGDLIVRRSSDHEEPSLA